MRISFNNALNRHINPFFQQNSNNQALLNRTDKVVTSDVVSFGAKKYDAEDIINPTNHCAYCGCKVYNQTQIESIAKEILQSKASRLEGKVKSVLEKLEGAKNAQDIALAKRLENVEQIKFFKNFLDIAEKKSFLRGDAIFEQVYNIDKDEALELLTQNMTPLLKTIDHVSPQNEDKDNNNSDVNLVEACYCCNHDLKKGAPFSEFYAIFPSIKNNMPSDKFNYAISSVLDSSQSSIMQRISAQGMLKLIERLFIQRTEASNYLDSIDYRIKGCKSSIQSAVDTCRSEIEEKSAESAQLQAELDVLMQDSEFVAMLNRNSLLTQLETQKTVLDSLRSKYQRTSDAINNLKNPKQNKKTQSKMTPEEREEKITSLKGVLTDLTEQIHKQEEDILVTELEIEEADAKFPTVDILQQRKNKIDAICRAHNALLSERSILKQKKQEFETLQSEIKKIQEEIAAYPDSSIIFDISGYSQEEQETYNSYCEMREALTYIEEHPNGGNLKSVIKESAKKTLIREIADLEKQDVIKDYLKYSKRKELESQLAKIQKSASDCEQAIRESQKSCENFEKASSSMSFDEASSEIEKLSETIRRLIDKQNKIKIPQRINILKVEISLLESTISDLLKKAQDIDSSFDVTV